MSTLKGILFYQYDTVYFHVPRKYLTYKCYYGIILNRSLILKLNEEHVMTNIVICCDGTGNSPDSENPTNVVHVYDLTNKEEDGQRVFYDAGIGTGGWEYNDGTGFVSMSDQATGNGLQKNVEDAYRFIMEHFREGDKIFLIGFSRGAFTVRALAGMLYKCGLLQPGNDQLIEHVSRVYNSEGNDESAAQFKARFCRPCLVHFIGVWDTVGSLLLSAGRRFHDTRLNPEVTFAYQALAIDERRDKFPPSLWDEENISQGQIIQQVWFAGAHSDVGGWDKDRSLSNIALRWMLGKAVDCSLEVDEDRVAKLHGDPCGPIHDSSEEGFWAFLRKEVRAIRPGALIHQSVYDRMKRDTSYRPSNLPKERVVVS